jgi:transcriptional antiterminator RfaH
MKWYVAQTKPSKERLAIQHLANQGFETFFPRIITGGREGDQVRSMFPSYVFVRFDVAEDGWKTIHSTLGVQRLLGSSQESPSPVRPDVMEWFLARGDLVEDLVRELSFRVGESVIFTDGPFQGRSGEVLRTSAGRVAVLLCLLGGQTMVSSDGSLLRSSAEKP